MKTLGLRDAAAFLRIHHVTLAEKAACGEVRGCKPGKEWVFVFNGKPVMRTTTKAFEKACARAGMKISPGTISATPGQVGTSRTGRRCKC